jgi:hypothetical protein
VENDRVQAAQDLLRTHLEDLVERASDEYNHDIWRRVNPLAEADLTRQMVQEWRDKSLEHISDSFERFFHAVGESHGVGERVRHASELSWQVINAVFGWESGDHSNYQVVGKCLFDDPTMTGELGLPRNPAGVRWKCIAEAINYDFWSRFDRLLKQLSNNKLSAAPPPVSGSMEPTSSGKSVSAVPLNDGSSERYEDPDLSSDDKKTRCIARAKVVAKVKSELDKLRPFYFSDNDFEDLAARHGEFITFEACAKQEELREPLAALQMHKQYVWLAIKIAAVKIGKNEATIEDNWRRYRKFLNVEPHKSGQLVACRKVTITSCYASKLVWRQSAKYLSPAANVRNLPASRSHVPCQPATSFAPSSS